MFDQIIISSNKLIRFHEQNMRHHSSLYIKRRINVANNDKNDYVHLQIRETRLSMFKHETNYILSATEISIAVKVRATFAIAQY